jgi:hypothetical protein
MEVVGLLAAQAVTVADDLPYLFGGSRHIDTVMKFDDHSRYRARICCVTANDSID